MRHKNVSKTRSATSMRQKNQHQKQKTQNKSKQQKQLKNICLTKGMSGKMA